MSPKKPLIPALLGNPAEKSPDITDFPNLAKKNLGDYQGAIADYNQAINIKPDYADAYINRGNAKSNLGDKQGVIADYDQAAQLFSQNMEWYRMALNNKKGFWGRLFS